MRQIASDKLAVILALKGTPIVLVACKKLNLPTSTFYRWKNSDSRFAKEVNRAISRGRESISDIAEARLVDAVKKGSLRAVLYWLKVFRHPYKKADKTIVEIKQTMRKNTERQSGRNRLMPTVPIGEASKLSPQTEKKMMKVFDKVLRDFERDRRRDEAAKTIMYKKGFTKEEIEEVLKHMDGKTDVPKLPTGGLDS